VSSMDVAGVAGQPCCPLGRGLAPRASAHSQAGLGGKPLVASYCYDELTCLFVELGIAANGRALPVDVQARTGRTSLHGSTAAASST
jgi:hypothetical protein